MRVLEIGTIPGPNVYSHDPVLVMRLDLQELAGRDTCEFPGFNERLSTVLPGLEEHHCALGRRGGFKERLQGGTYFSHTVEHVALELTDAAGIPVNRGKTVSSGTPGVYLVAVEYKSEAAMKGLLQTAVDLVEALLRGEEFDLNARVEEAKAAAAASEFEVGTTAIVRAAERRGIPWVRVDERGIVRLGYGKYRRYIEGTSTDSTRAIAVEITRDKDLTRRFLERAGIPAPSEKTGDRTSRGRNYRLIVVGGKLVAAAERDASRDVTDEVHPGVRKVAERAARAVGLDVCGIDLVAQDIAAPLDKAGGVVGIHAAPDIAMHLHPAKGQPRDVGAAIVDMLYPLELFPTGTPARVPVISITGTNGKTTVTRMTAHILQRCGMSVGLTTTDGIWIGCEQIAQGDMAGPWSAGVVLSDDSVDVAVLETARGGLFRSGLAYDWSDVSAITNIQLDHIGQDGIETIEDILWIKQLVAERVRAGGTLVLNADDRRLVELAQTERILRTPKRIVFFSLDSANAVVASHVAAGGTAYVVRDDWILERTAASDTPLVRASDIPMTLGGLARFQVANAMAALACALAAGADRRAAGDALRHFHSDLNNTGRMNLYRLRQRYVLLDYGHNPAALQAICQTVSRWPLGRAIGVVGLPGDRADSLLAESARVAACGFDEVIVREDKDLRGREPGEVPELLRRVIHETNPELPVDVVPDELKAIRQAVEQAREGDVVVVFAERVAQAAEMLQSMGAIPVSQLTAAMK